MSLLILVVDDEPDVEVLFRQQFRRDLRAGRFTMEFAQSAAAALERITDAAELSLILILSDINMPGSGLELLPTAKAARPDIKSYAAAKRKAQASSYGYVPKLAAATKDLGDRVQISIRDNGTGIPPEVRDKIFNPFFTTKPAGEGTGLGLSLSHDIVVKQHSGSIEIDTQPGEFTEFKITIPRSAASLGKSGERS